MCLPLSLTQLVEISPVDGLNLADIGDAHRKNKEASALETCARSFEVPLKPEDRVEMTKTRNTGWMVSEKT